MGYYAEAYTSGVVIPKGRKTSALRAINRMFTDKERKGKGHGGSWEGGQQKEVWYSWVSNPKDTIKGYTTLIEALKAWRWEAEEREDGAVVITNFIGEKYGQDELLFKELEDCIESGCSISWQGEDGETWEYQFENNRFQSVDTGMNPDWICSNCGNTDSGCSDQGGLCSGCQENKCECGTIEDGVYDNGKCKSCLEAEAEEED